MLAATVGRIFLARLMYTFLHCKQQRSEIP